jgi:hypothetical protein
MFKKFDGKEKIFSVMARGAEIGLDPFLSLEVFNSIHNGPPTIGKRGISILLHRAGYRLDFVENTDEAVTIVATYPGKAPYSARYTIAEARRAGYTKNAKYQTEPQEMLGARCLSRIATNYAAEILGGVPLALEDDAPGAPAAPFVAPQIERSAEAEANAFGARVAKAEDWLAANGLAEAAVTWFGPSNGWSNETLDEISRWAAQRKADAAAASKEEE